jgi:hypothetical protein
MRDNNNSEYQHIRMSRTSQAVVLKNVVALQIRYHISYSSLGKPQIIYFEEDELLIRLGIKGGAANSI